MARLSEDHKEIQSGKKLDDEGYSAKIEMQKIVQSINKLKKVIKTSDQQIPAWVQSKITKASDYLDIAADYLASDVEIDESTSFTINPKSHTQAQKREKTTQKIQQKATNNPSPEEEKVAKTMLSKRGPQLPEETSLVDKILAEMMGDKPGCDTKKPKKLNAIAKKHKVSIESLEKQLQKGIKIEMEHTSDIGEAETIALHHLDEIPDYYSRLHKMEKGAELNEDLRDWLKDGVGGGGWDRYNSEGERVGKCGDAKEGDPYSACLSKEKANKLGKEGIASFVKRKRDAQDKAGYDEKGEGPKGRKPVFVKTKIDEDLEFLEEKNEPTNPELWSKAKSLAKQKFDVYPSAYANLWASKWYKKRGGSWKSLDEATTRLPMQTGQLLRVLINWRGKHLSVQMFFPQLGTPRRDEITYAVNKVYPEARVISYVPCEMDSSTPIVQVREDWQKVNKKDKTDGMSQKAVDVYRRENPGSKLKTAVTEKNPSGKRKQRRINYCTRSKGQQEMHNIDCSKTPDKPICKARRRWKC
jgi:hypothetical protein